MEPVHMSRGILYGVLAQTCHDNARGQGCGGGACFAEEYLIGCPFDIYQQPNMGCGDIRPEHWREVFEGEDKPGEKKTAIWKVGDIVEVKNARDGKWYPGKILLIDKTSTPFFVQSEFGFKESSRLTRCLWCSEDQLRRLEEPEPEFHFGDKVTHYVDLPVRGVFSAYKDSPCADKTYAHVLFDGSPECEVVFARNLKAGWE